METAAGINAVRHVAGEQPLVLDRTKAYIGVLIDDLVTKGTREPYRMFTSRAEYRLILREDNADLRLRETGYLTGLVSDSVYQAYQQKKDAIRQLLDHLAEVRLTPCAAVNEKLRSMGHHELNQPVLLRDLLKRPGVTLGDLKVFDQRFVGAESSVAEQVEIQTKYDGYIKRQTELVKRFKKMEDISIPAAFEYADVPGLSNEVKEKLSAIHPSSIGQAARIPGITPAAVSILQVLLKKN